MRLSFLAVATLAATLSIPATAWATTDAQIKKLAEAAIGTDGIADYTDWQKLEAIARSGNANAQYYIGNLYYSGHGVPKSYAQYLWHSQNLNNRYSHIQGMSQNYAKAVYSTKAIYWYKKAAEHGFAQAETKLGGMYFHAHGVPENYDKAGYWYKKAANQGYAPAESDLGDLYSGPILTQNRKVDAVYITKAFYWYKKAAKQGYAHAESALGNLYMASAVVPHNYAKAFYWSKKAAKQGSSGGELDLVILYGYGEGVPQNIAKANYWSNKAESSR